MPRAGEDGLETENKTPVGVRVSKTGCPLPNLAVQKVLGV